MPLYTLYYGHFCTMPYRSVDALEPDLTLHMPPYRPNPRNKMVHILARAHLQNSTKWHRGDFLFSTHRWRYRGLKLKIKPIS